MKILSIDVGMKNLAICLFNIKNNKNYEIELWEIINLCKDENFICKEAKKNKSLCNKKAKFCKNGNYYCKTHAKNKKYKIPPNELYPNNIKKLKMSELKLLANKYNIKYQPKCLKSILTEIIYSYVNTNYLDYIKKKNTKHFNLIQYGRSLKTEFNRILKNIKIDSVIIENQIGPLALRMKTLQGMIMQHFIEKNILLIKEVSALNKLKEFIQNKKTSYNERKKLGIKCTQDILIKNILLQKWIDFFNKHKKKDDLADCFLQSIIYMRLKKYMRSL